MPRAAETTDLGPVFPWDEWEKQLGASPLGALVFDISDRQGLTVAAFKDRAKRAYEGHGIRVRVRGDEILLVLDA